MAQWTLLQPASALGHSTEHSTARRWLPAVCHEQGLPAVQLSAHLMVSLPWQQAAVRGAGADACLLLCCRALVEPLVIVLILIANGGCWACCRCTAAGD